MSDLAYPTLFSPLELGGVKLRNRLAHAAILTRFVRNGRATPDLINYHGARARGGAGLIVTEPIAMTRLTRSPDRLRAWDDAELDSLKRLADVVEGADTRLLGQIQDPGRGRHSIGRNDEAVGASALPDDLSWTVPRALRASEIRALVEEWADGAARLQRAGFSGVELSAGHGHLFHQFLSPWANRREDEYGRDRAGRIRFLKELIDAIRAACGHSFIIGLKLPGDDGVAGSIDLPEARAIAETLITEAPADYWTFAWGAHANSLWRHLPDAHGPRHPYLDAIRELRRAAPKIPTGALGYLTDPNECERALTDGTADLVFLGRPLITDPAFGNKARTGHEAKIRYCVSCNTCWRSIIEAGRLECDNNPRVAEDSEEAWAPRPAPKKRRIVVVGAGVAGLEAAHAAASRGHEVTVLSSSPEVGGKTRLHAALPGGENLSSTYDYLYVAGRTAGVRYELEQHATVDVIAALDPQQVLLATGSSIAAPPWLPEAYAAEGFVPDLRSLAVELLQRTGRTSGRAVLIDRDHTDMTYAVAELLAHRFDAVTLVTPRERIASDTSLINRQGIYERLAALRVEILPCHDLDDLDGLEAATLRPRSVYGDSAACVEDVVCLTYAGPRLPDDGLQAPLRELGLRVRTVGDARAPRNLLAATREGYRVGMSV